MPTPHRSDQHQLERLTGTLNRLNQSTAPKALTSTATCTNGSTAVVAAAVAIPLLVEARPYEIPSEAEPPLPDPTSGAFIGP